MAAGPLAVLLLVISTLWPTADTHDPVELVALRRPAAGSALVDEVVTVEYSRGSRSVKRVLTGSLVIDFVGGEARGTLRVAGDELTTYERRVKDGVTYTRYPAREARELGLSTPWVAVDGGESGGYLEAQVSALTPTAILGHVDRDQPFGYTSVEVIGRERVAGHDTTRYRLVADPDSVRAGLVEAGYPQGLADLVEVEVSADLWVDDDRLLRRVVLRNEQSEAYSALRATVVITQEVRQYGVDAPTVDVPPRPSTTWVSATEMGARFARVDPFEFMQPGRA